MSAPIPLPDVSDVDPLLVSASLCYLITKYQQRPTPDLSLVVKKHLQVLLKLSDAMSPEAHSTYRKLLAMWQDISATKKRSNGVHASSAHTFH